jgi:hypothetical protein
MTLDQREWESRTSPRHVPQQQHDPTLWDDGGIFMAYMYILLFAQLHHEI